MATAPAFDAPTSEWLVYADALQEARDPRGELISLLHAKKDITEFVKANAEGLLGDAAKYLDRYRITWHHCLIDKVDIVLRREDVASKNAFITTLLMTAVASQVRTIRLVGGDENVTHRSDSGYARVDLSDPMQTLAANLPPSCTTIGFIDARAAKTTRAVSRDWQPDVLVTFGSFEPFWAAKTIEHIEIEVCDVGQLVLGTIDAPQLKSLAIRSLCYGDPNNSTNFSPMLAEMKAPKLESFELRLPDQYHANIPLEENAYLTVYADNERFKDRIDEAGEGESDGTNWGELDELLYVLTECPLRRLAFTSCDSVDSLLETIAETRLAPTLKELDLSECSLTQESVKWFEDNKEMIGRLDRLILERTPLTQADVDRIAKIGPKVAWSKGKGAPYRFVVGSE